MNIAVYNIKILCLTMRSNIKKLIIMIYKVVFGTTMTELNNEVNAHINLGFQLQGGVSCQANILYQAMIKTK